MDTRKTKFIVPIVIAVAVLGAAITVTSANGGIMQKSTSASLATSSPSSPSSQVTDPSQTTYGNSPAPSSTDTTAKLSSQSQNSLYSGAASSSVASASPTSSVSAAASHIKMTAKEVDEVYRWSAGNGGNNPALTMSANADNILQIDNPTDSKHELVIESNGKEVATSGDIAPNSSGQVEFKPTAAGTYEYHCEYHPDTMKGTITVAAAPSVT